MIIARATIGTRGSQGVPSLLSAAPGVTDVVIDVSDYRYRLRRFLADGSELPETWHISQAEAEELALREFGIGRAGWTAVELDRDDLFTAAELFCRSESVADREHLQTLVRSCEDRRRLLDVADSYEIHEAIIDILTDRMLELNGQDERALEMRGLAQLAHRDIRTDETIDRLRAINPTNPRMLDLRIMRLSPQRDAAEVVELAEQLLAVEPSNVRALSFLVKGLHAQGRGEAARAVLTAFGQRSNLGEYERSIVDDLSSFLASDGVGHPVSWP